MPRFLGNGDHRGVGHTQAHVGIRLDQRDAPLAVRDSQVGDLRLASGDKAKEMGFGRRTETGFNELCGLRDRRSRDCELTAVSAQ